MDIEEKIQEMKKQFELQGRIIEIESQIETIWKERKMVIRQIVEAIKENSYETKSLIEIQRRIDEIEFQIEDLWKERKRLIKQVKKIISKKEK